METRLAREMIVEKGTGGRTAGSGAAVLIEKAAVRPQYAIAVDAEKCIGCRMCMVDCAAHNAGPKDLPVAYPRSWGLLPEAEPFADVFLPVGIEATASRECEACMEALGAGIEPVCMQVCPRGALSVRRVPAGTKDRLALVG